MSHFAEMSVDVFDHFWPLFGSPTLRIYAPIADWTLTAGVTYDSANDRFKNGAGATVVVNYATQPYTTVGYMPVSQEQRSVFYIEAGTEVPGLQIVIKYTAAVDAALDDFWAMLINGTLYRIADRTEREYAIPGVPSPSLIIMTLQDEVKTYG